MNLPEFRIGNKAKIHPAPGEVLDEDPRGILWIFEPPNSRARYVMGVDPSRGITGWHRTRRTQDDLLTDNGAVEVIRVGTAGAPDVQVAEYAAPVDAYEIAAIANAIGRLYAGRDENEQCLAIVEVWPGPGLATQRELIDRYGYTHHFVWKYLDSMLPKSTARYGWESHKNSVSALWIRGNRHISTGKIELRSPVLVEELANCEEDLVRQTAKAVHGFHDDRVRALLMAIWAAHEWGFDVETDATPALLGSTPANWQSSDISAERLFSAWEERFAEISASVEDDW